MPLRDNRPPLPPFCGHSRFANCTTASSSSTPVDAEWRLLKDSGSGCLGSFVSLLTTDAYVEAALCLHTQLRLLKSTCPLVLVYDDAYLSAAALSRLQQSFAANHLLPLSSLIERSAAQIARARQTVCTSRKCAKGGRLTNNSYRASGGLLEVHSVKKIWLWALPSTRFPIACYLDLDVLITSNLDALIEGPTSFELAAVQAVGCSSGLNVFNAALLVFRPSLSRLESLLRRERSYERVGQACENAITDQSVLNAEFRGGCRDYRSPAPCGSVWRKLPLSYNLNVAVYTMMPEESWEGVELGLIHFAGHYAKPWKAMPNPENVASPVKKAAMYREGRVRERWRRACAGG